MGPVQHEIEYLSGDQMNKKEASGWTNGDHRDTGKMQAHTGKSGRDGRGRFLTGNSGGGRPKGSRNKLTDKFIATVAEDFSEHGADALEQLRAEDPGSYLRLIAAFIPRALVLQKESEPDILGMTEDEVANHMWELQRVRRIREAIEGLKS